MPPLRDARQANQQPPAQIDRFAIIRRLGRGGFGTVYLVHDPVIDRRLALKLGHFMLPRRDGVSLREARLTARVQHPNVVTVYDAGEDPEQGQWIAMEYVEGESLADCLRSRKQPLPWREAVRIGIAIADGIQSAHARGLLHRDLKPANVLLGSDGRTVKVADFGLALSEPQREAAGRELAGTLSYMSPEQVRGNVDELDVRSDIWSLGVILYEMLSGVRPFSADKPPAGDQSPASSDLGERILHEDPPPLVTADPAAPPELAEICSRCLQRDAGRRPAAAEQVAAALRKLSEQAAPRSRRAVLALAAGLAVVGVGGGLAAWAMRRGGVSLPAKPPGNDQPANQNEWISLLAHPPEAVVWDHGNRDNLFTPVPPGDALRATSSGWGFLSLVSHSSAGFDMHLAVDSPDESFQWGAFWSLRPNAGAEAGGQQWCRAIVLSNRGEAGGKLQVLSFDISHNGQTTPHYLGQTIELDFQPAKSHELQLAVRPDGTATVAIDERLHVLDHWHNEGGGLPVGKAGIIVLGGSGVFHQVRFKQQ